MGGPTIRHDEFPDTDIGYGEYAKALCIEHDGDDSSVVDALALVEALRMSAEVINETPEAAWDSVADERRAVHDAMIGRTLFRKTQIGERLVQTSVPGSNND